MEIIKPEDIQLVKFLGAGGYGGSHLSLPFLEAAWAHSTEMATEHASACAVCAALTMQQVAALLYASQC